MRTDFYEIWLLNSMLYWVLLWQSGQTIYSWFKLYQICILWMTIKYMKLCQMLNQYFSQKWSQAPCIATWTSSQQIDQKWPICKLKFWYKKRIHTFASTTDADLNCSTQDPVCSRSDDWQGPGTAPFSRPLLTLPPHPQHPEPRGEDSAGTGWSQGHATAGHSQAATLELYCSTYRTPQNQDRKCL